MVYPMYKAFIEPDLQTAHIRINNNFNPFNGFQSPTYILKSGRDVTVEQIKSVLPEESWELKTDPVSVTWHSIKDVKESYDEIYPTDYVPELLDEQKDQVAVEQILRVTFLDVERPTPALEKLKHQLAEEAAVESRKKPPEQRLLVKDL